MTDVTKCTESLGIHLLSVCLDLTVYETKLERIYNSNIVFLRK